jgi:hypothetical protein
MLAELSASESVVCASHTEVSLLNSSTEMSSTSST